MSPETIARLIRSIRTLGVRNSWMLYREQANRAVELSLSFLKHPLWIRRTRADRHVFQQVFERHDYDLAALCNFRPRIIVDAGAHAGFTSVLFANHFPDATIYAIEPQSDNFQLLARNAAPYPTIKPINAALWHEGGSVQLHDSTVGSSSFQFVPGSGTAAVTLEDVAPHEGIDILKIDIEGAEKAIFERRPRWLSQVRVLLIETHDQFLPGCSQAVFNALAEYRYDRVIRGDVDLVVLHGPANGGVHLPGQAVR